MPARDYPAAQTVPDRHVHSEWSWDAARGDMRATCARAVELGIPAIAFTEHADFTDWVPPQHIDPPPNTRVPENTAGRGDLDLAGYWEALDRCRREFPDLRIESGVELGEPHLFPGQTRKILDHRPLDRVLGSLHCIELGGVLVEMSTLPPQAPEKAQAQMRRYLLGILQLAQSDAPFEILTHMDYPKRFWPHERVRFDERDYEEEFRAVLRALAASDRILEINGNEGVPPPRGPNPGLVAVRWWHEEGGAAVSFGSDAHQPDRLARGLAGAAAIADAAGFKPGADPLAFWRR